MAPGWANMVLQWVLFSGAVTWPLALSWGAAQRSHGISETGYWTRETERAGGSSSWHLLSEASGTSSRPSTWEGAREGIVS